MAVHHQFVALVQFVVDGWFADVARTVASGRSVEMVKGLSEPVTARLTAEGVIEKAATSRKAKVAVQDAFNAWSSESGRSLTEISRVLALSI